MKITTSLALAAALFAGGCDKKAEEGTVQKGIEGAGATTPPPPPPAQAATPLTGTALADRYKACLELVNTAKWDDFKKDCLDESYVAHQADLGQGGTHKLDEVMTWFASMKTAMPDWKLTPQLVVVSGRNILAVNLVTGTHTGPLESPMGTMPATNKKIGMLMFHRLALNDANKATGEWVYSDPMTMLGQLGLAPKDAPPVRPVMDKGFEGAPILVVTADDDKEKANLEASKKATEAINAGKYADAIALMQPDAVESDLSTDKDVEGAKAIETGMKMWFGAFKDAKVNVDHAYAAGDWVVTMGTFSGTHVKPIGPIKPTNKDVKLDYAEVVQMKDGKAAKTWRFTNGMQFAVQLGLTPPPSAPAPAADGTK